MHVCEAIVHSMLCSTCIMKRFYMVLCIQNIAQIYEVIAQQFYVKDDDRISDLDLLLYTETPHS